MTFMKKMLLFYLDNSSNFKPLDHLKGRCYTLKWPQTIDMTWLEIDFASQTSVSIHAPGEFFSSEKATFKLFPRTDTTINVLYETFTVLNFDGEQCHTDEQYIRDDCLYSAIQEESIKDIGCTTPYNPDKSNICSERDQAGKAIGVFEDITIWNQTKANILCPKPCQQYIISLSNKDWSHNKNHKITLRLEFPKYIRVSNSTYAYTWLELLAEVGGYVGLFLGVSINQVSNLFKIILTKITYPSRI